MIKQKNSQSFSFRINDEIKFHKEVRIVGEGIESKVVSLDEAKKIAESMDLDLVEINATANPPILRICRYDKLIYDMKRNAKKNKQAVVPIKEIQLTANIAQHDMETKANQARKFIEHGNKVKVILTLKGREMARQEENKKSIFQFIMMLDDVASAESLPKDEKNKTIVILKKKK